MYFSKIIFGESEKEFSCLKNRLFDALRLIIFCISGLTGGLTLYDVQPDRKKVFVVAYVLQ